MSPRFCDAFSAGRSKYEKKAKDSLGQLERLVVEETWRYKSSVRRITRLLGVSFGMNFGVHASDVATLARGLVERVFVTKYGQIAGVGRPVQPTRNVAKELGEFKRALVDKCARPAPWSAEHFVETRQGRKRKIYENALLNLPLLPERLLAELRTFVKAEKLNLTLKADPAPRVIQPRPPGYNVLVGRFVGPLEGVVYKAIKRLFGSVTVMKGMNAVQQGEAFAQKWESVDDPVGIGLDVHRMDQHVGEDMLRWEHSVYTTLMPYREFRSLLRKQLKNSGVGYCPDGRVKYTVCGGRMSGDMNTGLGNCLIMCAVIWTFMRRHFPGVHYELGNNGDDCILIVPRRIVKAVYAELPDYLVSMGLPSELEDPVDELEKVDFCQTHPVFNGHCWTMVRDVRICLDKDSNTLKPVRTEREWNTLRNTIGMSGLALAGHMPIFCEFYRALRRGAGSRIDHDETMDGMKFLARGMNMAKVAVTPQCRASFFKAFGIGPDEQLGLEDYFRHVVPTWNTPTAWHEAHVDGLVACAVGSAF
jgi:hypothetical protein